MVEAIALAMGLSLLISVGFLGMFDFGLLQYGYKSILEGKKNAVGVSIVIAAKNEAENLRKLIPRLLDQDHNNFEIVVVNDRSDDNTLSILQSFHDSRLKFITIDRVENNFDPKKYALTKGIDEAQKEIVLLTDADCLPSSKNWVSSMARQFDNNTKIVLGVSQYEKERGFLNMFIRYETLLTAIQYISMAVLGNPYMGVGRNIAYRKAFFEDRGGFDTFKGVTGGDDDLFVNRNASKKNTRVLISPDAMVNTYPAKNMVEFLQQKTRHLSVGRKYKSKDKLWIAIFNISNISYLITGIIFAYILNEPILFFSGLLIRWLLLMLAINRLLKNTGEKFGIHYIAVLDIIYILYYLFTGIRALFTKKVKWI